MGNKYINNAHKNGKCIQNKYVLEEKRRIHYKVLNLL